MKFIVTNNNLTVVGDVGLPKTINRSSVNFDYVLDELRKPVIDEEKVLKLMSIRDFIVEKLGDNLTLEDNNVIAYEKDNKKITLDSNNYLVRKILLGLKRNDNMNKYIKFLDNLVLNPLDSAIDELFLFLRANEIEITDDGHFLAFKVVDDDYTDCRTGTFDNSVGRVCEMPRDEVDADRERACSTGLHFCSKEYIDWFSSDCSKLMCIKVNPRDVVAIPEDYDDAKGRCCRYEVVAELKDKNDSLRDYTTVKLVIDPEVVPIETTVEDFLDDELEEKYARFSTVAEARRGFRKYKEGEVCIVEHSSGDRFYENRRVNGTVRLMRM